MKLFGHPLHVMLIHFPSALLPADLVLTILSFYYKDPLLNYAAFYCMVGGVIGGYLAIASGLIDLMAIPAPKKAAVSTALIHGGINGSIILVYTVLAYKGWKTYPTIAGVALTSIIIKAILVLALFAGNYFGGKLVYHYRIGIKENN